jgi:hypothetical protein
LRLYADDYAGRLLDCTANNPHIHWAAGRVAGVNCV